MSTAELKEKLIYSIRATENENILEEVYRLLEIESDSNEVYILNSAQREAIDEAREQVQNGQFLTDDEADKEIDEWLER